MTKVQEELMQGVKLLRQEKEADLAYYKEKVLNTPLTERVQEGVSWYPVKLGNQRFSMGEKPVVTLERFSGKKKNHAFQSGKIVSVFQNLNGRQSHMVSGVVNYVKDQTITITLNTEDIPGWLSGQDIGIDLLFDDLAYKEMEAALKEVSNAYEPRVVQLREILLGEQPPAFSKKSQVVLSELNESQNGALNKVINARDVAIVHGPPGTGKTTTLVHCILEVLKSEKQVMVCAPSNAAVDLLADKLRSQGVSLVRIGHPARVTEENLELTIDAQVANHTYYRDLKGIRKKMEEYFRLGGQYKRNFGRSEKQQRKMLYREAHALKDEANQLEQYIVSDILGRSQAVLCTLVGSANNLLKGIRFKTTFIDEAAQSLEAASWIPVIRSERVIMAGDHQQLPPTVKSFEAARQGLRFSLFEKIIQRKEELATPVDAMLRKQYRMNKKIMNFSSEYFYHHNLVADESVSEHVIHENLPPLLFIDTVGSGFTEQIDEKTLSTYNRDEGMALLEHLNHAIGEIGVERMLEEHITIGVIAPYRAQIKLLHAESEHFEAIQQVKSLLTIDTVDAFQGRERDMMYIGLVRSNEKGIIGFLGEIRRTNVAMTRARKRLVMMGDSATLSNHPFFQQLVAYCQENNAYESIFEIMQF